MQEPADQFEEADFVFSNEMLRKAYAMAGRPRLRGLIQQSVLPQRLTYRDFDMHVVPSDNFTEFTIWRTGRSPEEDELNWIDQTFRGQSLKVLDIGANAGLYSLMFATILAPSSTIHAFEPNPVMAARFENNCRLNGIGNVTLHRFALAAEQGEALLSFAERGDFATNLGQASLAESEAIDGKQTIKVKTEALANLAYARGADFCKVDIEGYEADVLEPYFAATSPHDLPRFLQLEMAHAHTWRIDLRPVLNKLGYVPAFETSKNTIFKIG